MTRVSRHGPALVLALAAALLMAPSLVLGTMPSNSSPQNLLWAADFSDQVRAGILLPRWMPDSFHGLGAPTFYFYPPLAFWFNSLVAIVTLDLLPLAYRLSVVWTLLLTLSGLAMFGWLRSQPISRRVAMIGALGYMAAPYHLFDHYIRGALAEFTAYAVLPLIVLAIRRLADRQRHGFALLAVTYAALILSHLPTALLISITVVPAYALFLAWRRGRPALLLHGVLAVALGIGLAGVYLAPALTLQDWILVEQLWTEAFQVGIWFFLVPGRWVPPYYVMQTITSIAAFWSLAALATIVALRRSRGEGWFWALLCLGCLLLMSGLLPWFWLVVPLVAKVQFPWRLLIVVEFAAVTALCHVPWRGLERITLAAFAAVLVAATPGLRLLGLGIVECAGLALERGGLPPQEVKEYLPAHFPADRSASTAERVLEPLKETPTIDCRPAARLCEATEERFGALRMTIDSDRPTEVVLRRFFFPAWRLDPPLPLVATDRLRLVSFQAPPGRSSYRLERHALAAERWGWALSGLSLALLMLTVTRKR